MKNFIAVFVVSLFFSGVSQAKDIIVDVNGLVCEFCAVTIEKSFNKKPQVKEVQVDLDSKKVTIILKEGQELSDVVVKDVIVNNGYNVEKISRK